MGVVRARGARGARGVRAGSIRSLLLRGVPIVLASQGRRISRACRVPAISGESSSHESNSPRAFSGHPGGAGDGDGLAAGIGAGGIVELDRLPRARTVGALKARAHAEGRRRARRTGQDLDHQVPDHAGPDPSVNCWGRIGQEIVQLGDVRGDGRQNP